MCGGHAGTKSYRFLGEGYVNTESDLHDFLAQWWPGLEASPGIAAVNDGYTFATVLIAQGPDPREDFGVRF